VPEDAVVDAVVEAVVVAVVDAIGVDDEVEDVTGPPGPSNGHHDPLHPSQFC